VAITKDNMGGVSRLCEEFHLGELSERLSQFRESADLNEDVMPKDLDGKGVSWGWKNECNNATARLRRCGQNCRDTHGCKNRHGRRASMRMFQLCEVRPLSRWRLLRLDRFGQLTLLLLGGILGSFLCECYVLEITDFKVVMLGDGWSHWSYGRESKLFEAESVMFEESRRHCLSYCGIYLRF
jgi:hypothetical protein